MMDKVSLQRRWASRSQASPTRSEGSHINVHMEIMLGESRRGAHFWVERELFLRLQCRPMSGRRAAAPGAAVADFCCLRRSARYSGVFVPQVTAAPLFPRLQQRLCCALNYDAPELPPALIEDAPGSRAGLPDVVSVSTLAVIFCPWIFPVKTRSSFWSHGVVVGDPVRLRSVEPVMLVSWSWLVVAKGPH